MIESPNTPHRRYVSGPSIHEIINSESDIFKFIISCLSDDELNAYKQYYKEANNQSFAPDLYLPNGCECLDIIPDTAIEIKHFMQRGYISGFMRRIPMFSINNKKINWLIIYENCHWEETELDYFQESIQSNNNITINFIQYSVIKNKRKSQVTTTKKQDTYTEAQKAFNRGEVVFFLGAGVSISAGLPSWDGLLKEIVTNETKHTIQDYENIRNESFGSSIITARYIKALLESDNHNQTKKELKYTNIIRNNLYKEINNSKLVTNICKLIRKKKIESIITYNYDDIIERRFTKNKKIRVLPVYGQKEEQLNKYIPIFHVHGYLPSNEAEARDSEIILSEEEYHKVYREPYHWASVVQLYALQYKTCFFIGLSMSDPNLRRLLDIALHDSNRDKARHFVFLQFHSNTNQAIQEEIMNNLGLQVIWFKDFDELAEKIGELSKLDNSANLP